MKKGLGAKFKLFSKKPAFFFSFFFNAPVTIHGVKETGGKGGPQGTV